MRTRQFKQSLRDGKVLIGTWIFEFNTPGITRLAASAGVDFIVYDMEHSGFGMDSIRSLAAQARALGLASLVRVPSAQYHLIAPVLDVGAGGIIAPMVQSAEDARRCVDSCRYPPLGRRGGAFAVAHDDFLAGDIPAKMKAANEDTVCSVIVESVRGVDNIDQIVATPGMDLVWVGFLDLSLSMALPGQYGHPEFGSAVERILKACRTNHVPAAIMVNDASQGLERIRQGFSCLSYSGDIWLFQRALSDGIRAIQSNFST